MQSDTLLVNLSHIVPPSRLLTRPAQLVPYESDALTAFRARPSAVVLAESQAEVIETVRACHRAGIPFVARGSGTSLSGGSLPIDQGVVIALNRLNKILHLDPAQRLAVVEPGVINLHVSTAAAPHGLYYAPDPSSQPICTIGGNVAFNSGGAHCLKYGMTSNHVLGIKAVLPDGQVMQLGGESLEHLGPDWTGLFVGSEGRFGVALEVTLRLLPKVQVYRTVLAAYHTLAAAGEAVSQVVASGLLPGAMEIMDTLAIQAAEASVHAGYPQGAGAVLIVELEGETIQVEAEFAHLKRVIDASGAYEVRVAQSDADRARIWKGRKGAFSAVGRLSPDYIVQDGVVPRSKLGQALAEIGRLSTKYDLRVANVFHAGDGNLHPLILYDGRTPGALHRAEELAGEILHMCVAMGGSITGEHGVGVEKRAYLPTQFQGEDMALLHRIRHAVDPLGIANQGKMMVEESPAPTENDPVAQLPAHPVTSSLRPQTIAEVQDAVRSASHIQIRGGGSKPALSTLATGESATVLEMAELCGILEYDPAEYTFTALAGTPVAQVAAALAEHGQYLPFDPLLVDAGATLGGVIATASAGPSRYRYGGVRDFILGVQFVDGSGRLLRGGGKVVKNAAGFDLPKMFVGSLGRLGVLVEATFKVFPQPPAYATLSWAAGGLQAALQGMTRLTASHFDIEALDLLLDSEPVLLVRLGGLPETLGQRMETLSAFIGGGERVMGAEEALLWHKARELAWAPQGWRVARVPLTPARIPALESTLLTHEVQRRYSVGGNLAWLAWPDDETGRVDAALSALDLAGVTLLGRPGQALIGRQSTHELGRRVWGVLDPGGRFGGIR